MARSCPVDRAHYPLFRLSRLGSETGGCASQGSKALHSLVLYAPWSIQMGNPRGDGCSCRRSFFRRSSTRSGPDDIGSTGGRLSGANPPVDHEAGHGSTLCNGETIVRSSKGRFVLRLSPSFISFGAMSL